MKKLLIIMLVLSLAVSAIPLKDKSYVVSLHYRGGGIVNAGIDVQHGYAPDRVLQKREGYQLVLKNHLGAELYRSYFEIQDKIEAPMRPDGYWGEWVPIDDFDHVELLPYFTEGKTVVLFDEFGRKIRTIDVSGFAQCDQDKWCSGRESFEYCSDCLTGEKGPIKDWIDGNALTPEEAESANLPTKSREEMGSGGIGDLLGSIDLSDLSPANIAGKSVDTAKSYWWLILLVILIVLWRRRKNKRK